MAGQTSSPIIDDVQAEGRLRAIEPAEQIDAVSVMTAPRAADASSPLASDTGVVRIVTAPEGDDSTDSQDAEMTRAEVLPDAEGAPLARVLIVEDTIELAELVMITLRRAQIAAEYEMRGERAFARYVALKPTVVLLDLNLPDMTGWKVLESIKEHVKATGAPMPRIIVMTALGDPANRLVGKLQGVYSYIVKPFTTVEVERLVRNALESQT
ncbi:MAG TPA: response regulator [Candidatus Limnocylindrales bacterium]|nr:response regulator [Candidatus Limnocylindrales bacterium]